MSVEWRTGSSPDSPPDWKTANLKAAGPVNGIHFFQGLRQTKNNWENLWGLFSETCFAYKSPMLVCTTIVGFGTTRRTWSTMIEVEWNYFAPDSDKLRPRRHASTSWKHLLFRHQCSWWCHFAKDKLKDNLSKQSQFIDIFLDLSLCNFDQMK